MRHGVIKYIFGRSVCAFMKSDQSSLRLSKTILFQAVAYLSTVMRKNFNLRHVWSTNSKILCVHGLWWGHLLFVEVIVCFIPVLHCFQQYFSHVANSLSHIATVSECDRDSMPNAYWHGMPQTHDIIFYILLTNNLTSSDSYLFIIIAKHQMKEQLVLFLSLW